MEFAKVHDAGIEQAVLGGLMLDHEKWDDVTSLITDSHFGLKAHRQIFRAMRELVNKEKPIDLILLAESLEQSGQLEQCGGFAYLAEVAKNTPSAANCIHYAKKVREYATRRELQKTLAQALTAVQEPNGGDVAQLLADTERAIAGISEQTQLTERGPANVETLLAGLVKRLESLNQCQDGITGVSTGFEDLDRATLGLQQSDLVIVAARPSMGKTTFAMNMVEHAAMTQDKPVVVFSLEMPADQLMMRMAASMGRVDLQSLRSGQMNDEHWARVSGFMGQLLDRPNLYIDDRSGLSPAQVRAAARRIWREHGGISMIMIDYLQLMRVPGMSDNRTLEISEISRSLKALAKELNCPVVALSQLNRGLENRPDKRPVNSDLRESGAIEQDADLIMFIYRDEVYNPNTDAAGIAEIIIGKQRQGALSTVRLGFQGRYARFTNIDTGALPY